MLRSMTGFGEAHGEVAGIQFSVEVRSVNNRYFRPGIKVPESFSAIEADVEALLRQRLRRGTVTVTVRMKVPDEQAAYRVNTAALASYIDQLRSLEVEANPMLRVDLGSLLLLPGVCEPPAEDLCVRTANGLKELVSAATEKLIGMRRQEGRAMQEELLANCQAIDNGLAIVVDRAPQVLQEYHDRLAARVAELTKAGNIRIDEDVLAREVAIFAERSDIAEEVTRLRAHVEQFGQALKSAEPAGRMLEFIAQEMLREANTLASKANDAATSKAVVGIKTAVDRIKEQVQNVE